MTDDQPAVLRRTTLVVGSTIVGILIVIAIADDHLPQVTRWLILPVFFFIWATSLVAHAKGVKARDTRPPACPSCGSVQIVLMRRRCGDHRMDASYSLCTDCRRRSGPGIWTEAPALDELQLDESGTLGQLLAVKERVRGPRPDELSDRIVPAPRPPRIVQSASAQREKSPLWDRELDGGP